MQVSFFILLHTGTVAEDHPWNPCIGIVIQQADLQSVLRHVDHSYLNKVPVRQAVIAVNRAGLVDHSDHRTMIFHNHIPSPQRQPAGVLQSNTENTGLYAVKFLRSSKSEIQ